MSQAINLTYINIAKFVLINYLEKDHSMIETSRMKNVVIFIPILKSFDHSKESSTEANSQAELFHKPPKTENICYQK